MGGTSGKVRERATTSADGSGEPKETGDSKNVENMETAKITETTIGVQNPNGSIEKIDITNEDLLAIAAIVGNV